MLCPTLIARRTRPTADKAVAPRYDPFIMARPGIICSDCAVRDRALCSSLSDAELESLNRIGRRHSVARGETLIWAGDETLSCANLLSGVLKLSATMADGREQIVGLLYPADFVGRPYAGHADFTVTALTDAALCVFPRKPFEQLLEDHARMERLLLQRTLAALDEARARMLTLGRKTAEERIAGFLIDMAARMGSAGDGRMMFELPLTRTEMADALGLTIETVSRQLSRLKAAGMIALPGGRVVEIVDATALRARADAT